MPKALVAITAIYHWVLRSIEATSVRIFCLKNDTQPTQMPTKNLIVIIVQIHRS